MYPKKCEKIDVRARVALVETLCKSSTSVKCSTYRRSIESSNGLFFLKLYLQF